MTMKLKRVFLLLALVVVLMLVVGICAAFLYLFPANNNKTAAPIDFKECAALHDGKIIQTYPRQCSYTDASGHDYGPFVEKIASPFTVSP